MPMLQASSDPPPAAPVVVVAPLPPPVAVLVDVAPPEPVVELPVIELVLVVLELVALEFVTVGPIPPVVPEVVVLGPLVAGPPVLPSGDSLQANPVSPVMVRKESCTKLGT